MGKEINKNLDLLVERLEALVIFRRLLKDGVIENFINAIKNKSTAAYAEMIAALYEKTDDLSAYLLSAVLEDENGYILQTAQDKTMPTVMQNTLKNELTTLQAVANVKSDEVIQGINGGEFLPQWTNSEVNFAEIYQNRLDNIHSIGYGVFAKYNTFVLKDNQITPVVTPDQIDINTLSGYERERDLVVRNTRALVKGKPSSNVLLYGDAGTGKSTTVKSVAMQFAKDGLRLIEVKKRDLYQLPELLDGLSRNPLKFIIFIDDLSFSSNDDNFAALKAILEGSVSSANGNISVYATSNRRHLIKETFSDRQGDDIHENDTKEELRSLSARFGLTITFSRPDKDLFLSIIDDLAKYYGVKMEKEEMHIKAEAFALRASGRSPRVAKQFIKSLAADVIE